MHGRVVSLAHSCLRRYRAMPGYLRITATACIGAMIGYVTYLIVFALNPIAPRATTSWLLAFLINVSRQHALHRWLTFDEPSSYWPSLTRAYVMYSGTAVATTSPNWFLVVRHCVDHKLAWLACMRLTASISLIFLRRFVFRLQ